MWLDGDGDAGSAALLGARFAGLAEAVETAGGRRARPPQFMEAELGPARVGHLAALGATPMAGTDVAAPVTARPVSRTLAPPAAGAPSVLQGAGGAASALAGADADPLPLAQPSESRLVLVRRAHLPRVELGHVPRPRPDSCPVERS